MPAYKRKRTSKSGLSWTAYNLAKQIDNDTRVAKHDQEVAQMAEAAKTAAARLSTLRANRASNLSSMGIAGRGRYSVGNFVKDMRTLGLNRYTTALGDMGLGAAQSVINSGTAAINRAITGRGAYGIGGANDLFSGDDKDDIVISHSEFLTSITPSSADFQTQFSTVLNPGLQTFAPMLAQVAQFYEEYEFIQLVFEFRSTVVDGNDNAAGTLLMATQYNPTNALFNNEVTMDNYAHSCATKVTDSLLHGVECEERATGQTRFEYVRTGPVPAGQDPKTYDLAIFQVATQGAYAGLQLGRLYVHYKVRLSKLKLVPVVSPAGIQYSSFAAEGSSITTTALFGSSAAIWESGNMGDGFSPATVGGNVITIPKTGTQSLKYLVSINLKLGTAANAARSVPSVTNGSICVDGIDPNTNFSQGNAAVSQNYHCFVFLVDQDDPNEDVVLTFAWTGFAGAAGNAVNVLIQQVSNDTRLPNAL